MGSIISIYSLKCPLTSEVRYVGQSTNLKRRLARHLKDASSPSNKGVWIKGLLDKGLKPIMEVIEVVSELDMEERERYWIAFYGDQLTNMTSGGLKTKFNDDLRLKLSIAQSLVPGHPQTEETKRKISEANSGIPKPYMVGNKLRLGLPNTPEMKAKISAKLSGELNPNYGKTQPDNVKKMISEANSKPIIQYDKQMNEISRWPNQREPMRQLDGVHRHGIQKCLSNKIKTAYGFIWKYDLSNLKDN